MKNSSNQGARRSAYVDTDKTGNAEWADFSYLPEGLEPQGAAKRKLAMLTRFLYLVCACRLALGPLWLQRDLLL